MRLTKDIEATVRLYLTLMNVWMAVMPVTSTQIAKTLTARKHVHVIMDFSVMVAHAVILMNVSLVTMIVTRMLRAIIPLAAMSVFVIKVLKVVVSLVSTLTSTSWIFRAM